MKWQPIETAPKGVIVKMGRWVKSWTKPGGLEWVETIGKAKHKTFFPWSVSYTWDGASNTHWQPLPEPPTE